MYDLDPFHGSKIPVVASTDLDFGFAMAALSSDKTTLLPGRLTDELNDFL
jgi:hypothetical protein